MADLPDIVKRAATVHDAIGADLAAAGGILRCGTCSTEQPVGDVASHLRHGWPQCCGKTMSWVTRRLLLAERREVPDGYELVAVPSAEWRLGEGKRCRSGAGYRHRACGRPSVAEFNRGTEARPVWFAYCADDRYGNWIEDGQVMHWILREVGDDA